MSSLLCQSRKQSSHLFPASLCSFIDWQGDYLSCPWNKVPGCTGKQGRAGWAVSQSALQEWCQSLTPVDPIKWLVQFWEGDYWATVTPVVLRSVLISKDMNMKCPCLVWGFTCQQENKHFPVPLTLLQWNQTRQEWIDLQESIHHCSTSVTWSHVATEINVSSRWSSF